MFKKRQGEKSTLYQNVFCLNNLIDTHVRKHVLHTGWGRYEGGFQYGKKHGHGKFTYSVPNGEFQVFRLV